MTTLTPLGRVHTSARSAITRTVSAHAFAPTVMTKTHAAISRKKDICRIMAYACCHPATAGWSCQEDERMRITREVQEYREAIGGTPVAQPARMNRRGYCANAR